MIQNLGSFSFVSAYLPKLPCEAATPSARLIVLDILIAAGWADWPQERIPPDVIASAEAGQLPRRCTTLTPSVYAHDPAAKPRPLKRERLVAHAGKMRSMGGKRDA